MAHNINLALITGCPRCGTGMLRRWLDTHLSVATFHESRRLLAMATMARFRDSLPLAKPWISGQYAAITPITRLVIEKEPLEPIAFPDRDYMGFINSVWRVFPQAKIILCHRSRDGFMASALAKNWGGSLAVPEARKLTSLDAQQIFTDNEILRQQLKDNHLVYSFDYDRACREPLPVSSEVLKFLDLSPINPLKINKK